MAYLVICTGIFLCLVTQLDRIARHNRQDSELTKRRDYAATKRFLVFLADEFHLQGLANISQGNASWGSSLLNRIYDQVSESQ